MLMHFICSTLYETFWPLLLLPSSSSASSSSSAIVLHFFDEQKTHFVLFLSMISLVNLTMTTNNTISSMPIGTDWMAFVLHSPAVIHIPNFGKALDECGKVRYVDMKSFAVLHCLNCIITALHFVLLLLFVLKCVTHSLTQHVCRTRKLSRNK